MNLSVVDVTRLFDVSEKTVHEWIRSRHLPALRVNDQYHFNRSEVLEWAATQHIRLAEAGGRGTMPPPPTLVAALEAGGIHYGIGAGQPRHLPAADRKPAILAEVVARLPLPAHFERGRLLDILLAREAMGSTAIGDGIAIPHPRHPIVLNGGPSISLCYLEHPVDFGALDGQPVGILFTLISPTVPVHLALLSRLMFVLREPLFKKILLHQGTPDEILQGVRHAEATLLRSGTGGAQEEGRR